MLEVLYHHAKFGEARISPTARAAKNVEFFVCLSVRHAFERQSRNFTTGQLSCCYSRQALTQYVTSAVYTLATSMKWKRKKGKGERRGRRACSTISPYMGLGGKDPSDDR